VPGHDWFEVVLQQQYPPWLAQDEARDRRHETLLRKLWRLVHAPGLSGAAWTQLTDIEGETNGLMTYDRAVIKNNVARIADANRGYVSPNAFPCVTATDDTYWFTDAVTVELVAARADATIHYTLDGSEPTAQSTSYTGPVKLTATTTIKAIALWPNHPLSSVAVMHYKKATDFQPASIADKLQPGLAWQYVEDDRVAQSRIMEYFTFRPDEPFVKEPKKKSEFRWAGFLQVPRDGVYTLQRPANNMGLTIGKKLLFSKGGGGGDREETVQIGLAAGLHRLDAAWLQSETGYYSLDCPIHIEGPGIAKQPIPAAWLKHEAP
jgi:hexosaminidase